MPKFIVPGSLEVRGTMLVAGVHDGPSEWEVKNLRYVSGEIKDGGQGKTVQEFMEYLYDNSTGCLVNGGFKMKEGT